MRRFFLDPDRFDGRTAIIGGNDSRHIRKVLRMQPGSALALVDGAGALLHGRIAAIKGSEVIVAVEGVVAAPGPPLALTLALGYLKDDKMDLVLRQATELGITRWQPFWAQRSVARPPAARLAGRLARWEKIAREAVKQCRRGVTPRVCAPVDYDEMLDLAAGAEIKLLFWEQTPEPFNIDDGGGAAPQSVWIVLGPEGGLTEAEAILARDRGFGTAGLGPRILRAETAAIVACALVQHRFGDMGPRLDREKNLDKQPLDQ